MHKNSELRVPFTQQFTPEQTPMENLLILLENLKNSSQELKSLIANNFLKTRLILTNWQGIQLFH
jgi:hypothetical protein